MTDDIVIIDARIFDPRQREMGIRGPVYVEIRGERIAAVGAMADYAGRETGRVLDARGGLVMPGLVNGHTHAAMTLFRGLADDLPLMTWLEKHIFPAEARFVTAEMVYWSSKLAAAEMILAGTTTVADGYFFEDEAARAFAEAGLRAVAAHGIIDFPAPGVADPKQNVATAGRFLDRWLGHGLVTPALFVHSPYTCSPETMKQAKQLAGEKGVPLFIHLAESRLEYEEIMSKWGKTPLGYLHSLGLLDPETVCVHCVWLDEGDISLLAESGAGVVTCPESNMKLASGIAPLAGLRAGGIRTGIGTDGCASNNDLDLFREMDCCAKLHKVAGGDPAMVPAAALLEMATHEGAGVLGVSGLGSLEPGMLADLVIIDPGRPHLIPFHSPDNLVYAATGADVDSVIINGRLVMEGRKILTFDVAEAMERVTELAGQVSAFLRPENGKTT